jgi:hypothetical protein
VLKFKRKFRRRRVDIKRVQKLNYIRGPQRGFWTIVWELYITWESATVTRGQRLYGAMQADLQHAVSSGRYTSVTPKMPQSALISDDGCSLLHRAWPRGHTNQLSGRHIPKCQKHWPYVFNDSTEIFLMELYTRYSRCLPDHGADFVTEQLSFSSMM